MIFHLFPTPKEFFDGKRFKSNEEVKDDVKGWLNRLVEVVYDENAQKLVIGYYKCLNAGGDCVEK